MAVCVVHLSDTHFTERSNSLDSKVEELAGAICSIDTGCKEYVIVLSGDIAYSGNRLEYLSAHSFFSDLTIRISQRVSGVRTRFLSVPGNHDCQLAAEEVSLRNVLIEGMRTTFQSENPDPAILQTLLRAQVDYFEFEKRQCGLLITSTADEICKSVELILDGVPFEFHLYNTAIMSRRKEQQTLSVPRGIVEKVVKTTKSSHLSIAVFHHPYTWLDHEVGTAFRSHIEETSDVVLTGHEHFPHSFSKNDLSPRSQLYSEGDVLQEGGQPEKSGFKCLLFDPAGSRYSLTTFSWDGSIYQPVRTDWQAYAKTASSGKRLVASAWLQAQLTDPGIGIRHHVAGSLTLEQFFVFPDAVARNLLSPTLQKEINGSNLFDYISSKRNVYIQGSPRMGKTCLAKSLVKEWLSRAQVYPLLVSGHEIEKSDSDYISRLIEKAVRGQYGDDVRHRYSQLPPQSRALLIDDWDNSPLTAAEKDIFVQRTSEIFGHLVAFVDSSSFVEQLISRASGKSAAIDFEYLSLKEFSYRSRGQLIDKWVGLETKREDTDFPRLVEDAERLVKTIIGKHTLPSLPFIVLSILAASHQESDLASVNGSFGYLYEVLITTALNSSDTANPQLDKKYEFLARLAFDLFESNEQTVGRARLDSVLNTYEIDYLLKLGKEDLIRDLVKARILVEEDGTFSFAYPHYFYYFLARYFKSHLHGARSVYFRNHLRDLTESLPAASNSIFLMFLIYLTSDETLTDDLLSFADKILADIQPAELTPKEVDFYLEKSEIVAPHAELADSPDLVKNRETRRDAEDTLAHSERLRKPCNDRYSDALPSSTKLMHGGAYVEILGQLLRNFTGSLPGHKKLRILNTTISLGLRMLSTKLDLLRRASLDVRQVEAQLDPKTDQGKQLLKLTKLVNRFILEITHFVGFAAIHNISLSVGSKDIDEGAYLKVLGGVESSVASSLVAFSLKLDHNSPPFPLDDCRQLLKRFKSENWFAYRVVVDMVAEHIEIFDVGWAMRQKVLDLIKSSDRTKAIRGDSRRLN